MNANYACTYSGSGGAIVKSITIQSGYTQTVTLDPGNNTIYLDTLTQSDGDLNLATASAKLEVDDWFFYGGDFNADIPVAAQIKAKQEIKWVSANTRLDLGNHVELASGGVGTIELTGFNGVVDVANNANITNNGVFTHKSGKVSASGATNSTNVFDNKGTYKKTTTGEGSFSYMTFKNTNAAAVLSVEGGALSFVNKSGASTAAFVQTAGTTKVAGGTRLDGFTTVAGNVALSFEGGNFYTIGTTKADLVGHTLFENCVVQLSYDDLTKVGKLEVDGKVIFAGSAEYICKLKGDGSGADRITATGDITLDNGILGQQTTITLWVLGTLQTNKSWTVLETKNGNFQGDFVNIELNGFSLATAIDGPGGVYEVNS